MALRSARYKYIHLDILYTFNFHPFPQLGNRISAAWGFLPKLLGDIYGLYKFTSPEEDLQKHVRRLVCDGTYCFHFSDLKKDVGFDSLVSFTQSSINLVIGSEKMFCNKAMAKVLAIAWYDMKKYKLRTNCRKYTNNVSSEALIVATVTFRYPLDNWSSGVYTRRNFEGGLFKGRSD